MNTTTEQDLVIIGGGINGAGIARDAIGRGLSVTLLEQADLASGSTSASTKLFHGGLRYLDQYRFLRVRKALKERKLMCRNAPHLIRNMTFILPHQSQSRPCWLISLGLLLYDLLGAKQGPLHAARIHLQTSSYGNALLPRFDTGFSYNDCYVDDSRLVIMNAIEAFEKGANILLRTKFISARREQDYWQVKAKDVMTGEDHTIHAKAIVNAAGPWVLDAIQSCTHSEVLDKKTISFTKGSHIVVPRFYIGEHAFVLQHKDGRFIFVLPFQEEFCLIGTTDYPYTGDASKVSIEKSEIDYLCHTVNSYFDTHLQESDIIWHYSGVRVLQHEDKRNLSVITRKPRFYVESVQNKLPLIVTFDGKITTYRLFAERIVNALKPYFPHMDPPWTAYAHLPGGHFDNFDELYLDMDRRFPWLPQSLVKRLVCSYGTRMRAVMGNATAMKTLGVHFGADLYECEVRYLRTHEWAKTAEDILWRRTKLGLLFNSTQVNQLAQWLAANP